MADRVLLLASDAGDPLEVVPALAEVAWEVVTAPLDVGMRDAPREVGAVLVDATEDLPRAVTTCRRMVERATLPVLLVVSSAVMAAVKASWGFDDWVERGASAAELGARLRIARQRARERAGSVSRAGPLILDPDSYAARLRDEPLDLTPTEFEVLKALIGSAGQVLSREALLRQAWGEDDFYGGIRKVDVYIRRLRSKLGPEFESLIVTVRGVGYKLVPYA